MQPTDAIRILRSDQDNRRPEAAAGESSGSEPHLQQF